MSEHHLGKEHSGSVVRARPGDTIVVVLDENPTTGYRWHVKQSGGSVLAEPEAGFEPTAGGAIGSGGRRRLAFRVTGPGRAEPELVLRRAEDRPDAAIDRWRAVVEADQRPID